MNGRHAAKIKITTTVEHTAMISFFVAGGAGETSCLEVSSVWRPVTGIHVEIARVVLMDEL